MNFSLRLKLIFLTTFLVTVMMTTITYFFTIRDLESKRNNVEVQTQRLARNIATMQLVDRLDWSIYQNYISQLTNVNDDIVYIAIFDERQSLRAHSLNLDLIDIDPVEPLPSRTTADIVKRLTQGGIASESQRDIRSQTVNIQSGDRVLGSVQVGFSLIEINNIVQRDIVRNVLMAFLFLMLFGTIAVILSGRLTKPLVRLSGAMREVESGNLDLEVVVENRDEIGQLAMTFNEMVAGFRERRIIEKLGRELGATFQLDRLSILVRERVKSAIGASGARLFLRDRNKTGEFHEISQDERESETISLNIKARKILLDRSDGISIEEASEDVKAVIGHVLSNTGGMIIPMLVKSELFGLLIFEMAAESSRISQRKRHFASILANQAALALENSLLYDDLREQERMRHELTLARAVQQKLLPGTLPRFPGFQIEGMCLPATEIGGDYYDIFNIDNRHVGLVIADVSGKGASAAFYMAEIKGMMTSMVQVYREPKKLLVELNRNLYQNIDRNVFASMVYGVLDVKTKIFKFARAGHNSLVFIDSKGECDLLTPPGIGLGLDSGETFEEKLEESHLSLNEGDSFLLYTDGLTEAMNEKWETYGEDRLVQSICNGCLSQVKDMPGHILNEIKKHVNGHDQHDDLTMVFVKATEVITAPVET